MRLAFEHQDVHDCSRWAAVQAIDLKHAVFTVGVNEKGPNRSEGHRNKSD